MNRMKADACASEEKLLKLSRAGSQSWSALTAALTETRAVFDRANQTAWEAFKRAHLNQDNRPNYGEIAAWRSLHIVYAPMRQHVLI